MAITQDITDPQADSVVLISDFIDECGIDIIDQAVSATTAIDKAAVENLSLVSSPITA